MSIFTDSVVVPPPGTPPPALRLFGLRREGALRGVDLDLPEGGRCALLGPAGAGKSALIAAVAGLLGIESGAIDLAGRPAAGLAPHRRGLALVLPGDGPLPGRSVAASVAFAAAGSALAREALAVFDLTALTSERAGGLSRAEAVRVALARAAASGARLLLLDDPCAGLAAAEAGAVLERLAAWCAAHPVAALMATREPAHAFALGGDVALLQAGQVVQAGPVQTVFDLPASPLAARLMGAVNLLPGTIAEAEEDFATVRLACGLSVEAAPTGLRAGAACVVAIRPGRIALAAGPAGEIDPGALPARLCAAIPLGAEIRFDLALGAPAAALEVLRPAGAPLGVAPGGEVAVAWQPWDARILPPGP